jgi:hypothetical protein
MGVGARRVGVAAILLLGAVLGGGEVRAANWFEMNFWLSGPRYDGVLPSCDAPSVFEKIIARFAEKENLYWNSHLAIVAFDDVRENAFRPWAADTIPRRWCSGFAYVSDGRKHPVFYSIGEDTGMIGQTFGVEWCVVGLDRNWAYNPACKVAQP